MCLQTMFVLGEDLGHGRPAGWWRRGVFALRGSFKKQTLRVAMSGHT
jgi:hypothetical protein